MGQKYCKLKSNLDKADQRCLETKAWVAAKTDWPQPFRTAYSAWCPSCSRSRPARQRSLGRWVGCQRSLLEPCIAGSTFQCSDLEAWRSRAWPILPKRRTLTRLSRLQPLKNVSKFESSTVSTMRQGNFRRTNSRIFTAENCGSL